MTIQDKWDYDWLDDWSLDDFLSTIKMENNKITNKLIAIQDVLGGIGTMKMKVIVISLTPLERNEVYATFVKQI